MEKILLVEDCKIITNFVKRTLQIGHGNCEVVAVSSFDELKELFQETKDFTMALVDIYLLDVYDLSILDYVIEHKIPTIAMTASFEEDIYEQIKQKNVIDFVLKDSIESINYIVLQIKRLLNNRHKQVLVVDDSKTSLNYINSYLKPLMYKTILESEPLKALEIVKKTSIDLIITDYYMPKLNGVDLIKEIRKDKPKDKLGIIGISSDEKSAIHFLKFGANDFIKKPFIKEEFAHRVNNLAQQMDDMKMLRDIVNTDYLTKIYNRRYFYEHSIKYFKEAEANKETFAIGMMDIDNFKSVNDTYGHDMGDLVIRAVADVLKSKTKGSDIVARFGGEEFVVLLKNISYEASIKVFNDICSAMANKKIYIDDKKFIQKTISVGITQNGLNSIDEMIKVADERLYIAKNNGKNQVVSEDKVVEEVS